MRIEISKWARGKARTPADAEDLAQDAMLHLCRYLRHEGPGDPGRFLRRTLRDLSRRELLRQRSKRIHACPIEQLDRHVPLIAAGPTPEQALDAQQNLDNISAFLQALNPRTREIFFAHLFGYTHVEIALHLGIAVISVDRHIARAHAAIAADGE
jgi:RNA polymerase sigma factor (sigma-70 family)